MKIYIAHSREFDYENELYNPIRNDEKLTEEKIILPHENEENNNRDYYKNIDLMIAECSYPSTGLGIELGWAFDDNIPIYCIYNGNKISGSINAVTNNIYEYNNIEEMLNIIEEIIESKKDISINQR